MSDDRMLSDEGPDDALDRLIADAARDYHRPPVAVPRDAMWDAIVAQRAPRAGAAPAAAPAVLSLDAARAERADRVARRTPTLAARTWSLAAAASLLLAAGVGVGRWWEGRARVDAPTVAVAPAAQVPSATNTVTAQTPDAASPAADTTTEAPAAAPATIDDRAATREVATARAPRAPRAGLRPRDDGGALAYDVTTVRHLTAVEALMVSYRADPLDSLADARVASWARTLLQDTRLLLDSPAASTPVRRRLFEDLELVLVQMARLAPADSASVGPAQRRREREERALIDGTMRDVQVMPRLRRAIPAGVGS